MTEFAPRPEPIKEETVLVCSKCLTVSCRNGMFTCSLSYEGDKEITVKEFLRLGYEDPSIIGQTNKSAH